jgi:hypothetical protein
LRETQTKGIAMKQHHRQGARLGALYTLKACNIRPGQDFHMLSAGQVDELLKCADFVKYRKPRSANGSRARYFHDLLQRRARLGND